MDPTLPAIQLKNSFSKPRIPATLDRDSLSWYTVPLQIAKKIIPVKQLSEIDTEILTRDKFQLLNCDATQYLQLQNLKDQFAPISKSIFNKARINTNPYEKLGRSIFGNRAAVKLANVDALYNLTGTFDTFPLEDSSNYIFCDIASAPGSWSEYLQFRKPDAHGYAMSIRSKDTHLNFDTKRLNMEKMTIEYGPDNTGNLYTNHLYFANLIRVDNPEGVDLVMGDGGLEVENREDLQEILSSRLILTELLVGLKCLKETGRLLIKLFDSVLQITQDIIYIASLCFDKISIVKPISSRPANAERYLIGYNYRPEIGAICIKMIEEILIAYDQITQKTNQNMFGKILDVEYDPEFNAYMTEINNYSIQNQMIATQSILEYANNQNTKLILVPELNLNLAFQLWKLPGNIPGNRG